VGSIPTAGISHVARSLTKGQILTILGDRGAYPSQETGVSLVKPREASRTRGRAPKRPPAKKGSVHISLCNLEFRLGA
jgi:hypothetical protein